MRLHQHVVASGTVSAGIFAVSRSLTVALVSFVSGFLIDLDHYIDFWRENPFDFNVRRFFATCEGYELRKLVLVLHSWELLLLLAAFTYLTRSGIALGLLVGGTQHLLLDQKANYTYPLSYSFIYRFLHGFRGEAVFDAGAFRRQEAERGNH